MPQNEEQAIRNLQTYLRQLAYHEPDITLPPVDGIFARDTEQALRDFQRTRALPQTGVADQLVWELLYDAYLTSLAIHSPPQPMEIFPRQPVNFAYSVGDRGFAVAAIRHILRELEYKYGAVVLDEVSDLYDEITAAAVAAFQQNNRLQPTGRVDRVTWDLLADQHNLYVMRYGKE